MRFMPIFVVIAFAAFFYCSWEKDPVAKQVEIVSPVEKGQDSLSETRRDTVTVNIFNRQKVRGPFIIDTHPIPVKPNNSDSTN
jgi:hypothetical protein